MTRPEDSSRFLLWIGGAVVAAGFAILAGFWVYGITTAKDLAGLLIVALLAIPVGFSILLVAAIRDRIVQKRKENFLEVDH